MYRFFKKRSSSTPPLPLTTQEGEFEQSLKKNCKGIYKDYLEMFNNYKERSDVVVEGILSWREYDLYFDREVRRKEPLSFDGFSETFSFNLMPNWRVSR